MCSPEQHPAESKLLLHVGRERVLCWRYLCGAIGELQPQFLIPCSQHLLLYRLAKG